MLLRPFESTFGEKIADRDGSSRLVHHPEVLDVDAEQLAAVLAEISIVEPDQSHQVGVDPEISWTGLVAAVITGRGRRRRHRSGTGAGA